MKVLSRLDIKVTAILIIAMLMSSSYAIWLYSKQSLIFSKRAESSLSAELQRINSGLGQLITSKEVTIDRIDLSTLATELSISGAYSIIVDKQFKLVSSTLPRQHFMELTRPELQQNHYVVTISSRLDKAEILVIYHELPGYKIQVDDSDYVIITVPVFDTIPEGYDRTSVWWQFLIHAEKFVLLFLLMVTVAVIIVLRSFKPLRKLERVAQQLANNEVPEQIPNTDKSEIGDVISAFNHASIKLQQFQQQREQMTSDIAHELRTPITNMLGRIEALEENIIQDERAVISFVSKQLNGLAGIVEDMALLSMADSDNLTIYKEAVMIADFIREWAAQYDVEQHLTLSLSLQSNEWNLDVSRLTQILDNLLANSRKAKPSELNVYLSSELEQENLVIKFEDDGPGVTEEHFDKLFDRLYRVDTSRNEATGGSGLGLSIVKSLVEAQQGRVEAFSSEKGGLGIKMTFKAN